MCIPVFIFIHTNLPNISNACLRHHRVSTELGPTHQPLKFFLFPNPANIFIPAVAQLKLPAFHYVYAAFSTHS